MNKNYIINKYFEWMSEIICGKRFTGKVTYRKLTSKDLANALKTAINSV